MTKVKIHPDQIVNIPTIDLSIEALKMAKKELQGKVIYSMKGLKNKIKYYFLGYIYIEEKKKK